MNLLQTLILNMPLIITAPAVLQAQSSPDSIPGALPRIDSMKRVTVTAGRNPLQVENGRIVMNLANSALTTGSSVFDLLKKMPGISVGQDDNISLRGTEGVNVMIDGKMNYLSNKQLADFLKGLAADNVARIELITTPTAEFDAAGNAGIINIVTRKRTTRGYAIDLKSAVTRASTWLVNENVSANYNNKQFSLYSSFDYNTPNRRVTSTSGNTIQENGSSYKLYRNNTNLYKIKFYTYRLGGDWRLNRLQVSVNYHGYFDDFIAPKDATAYRYNAGRQLQSVVHTQNKIIEPYHYNAANLAFTWNIDTAGKKLTAEAHSINYRNLSDALMISSTADGSTGAITDTHALRSHQPGYITIRSAKTDLEWPYKRILFKTGFKYARVSNDNNYRFDSLVDGNFRDALSMSNHFIYTEKIAAAYLSASGKFKNTSVTAGLRIEHTDADGYTVNNDFTNRWAYTSFFPSLLVDQALKQHKLSISLSRRINRPTYSDLNPVRWYTDPYFYYAGNPGLVPELAWLLSTAWTIRRKYIITATYNIRENYMTKRLETDAAANAVKSQTANFRYMQRLDMLFSAPFSAGRWSMQVSASVNYSKYPLYQLTDNTTISRWAANTQVQQQVQLPAGIKAEAGIYFVSRELWGTYIKHELFFLDAGLRKSFFKDNLLLQLSFTDLLRTYRLKGTSQSTATDYWYNDRPDIHRVGLSVRYHIGGKAAAKKMNNTEEQERL